LHRIVELCRERDLVLSLGLDALGYKLLTSGQLSDDDLFLPIRRHGEPVSLCLPFLGVGPRFLLLEPDLLSVDAFGLRHFRQRANMLANLAECPSTADDVERLLRHRQRVH